MTGRTWLTSVAAVSAMKCLLALGALLHDRLCWRMSMPWFLGVPPPPKLHFVLRA